MRNLELLIDYETRSRADLPLVGQHIYARHESTEILCIGYKVIGSKNSFVVKRSDLYTYPLTARAKHFIECVKRARILIAHNAPFEQAITNFVLKKTTLLKDSTPLNLFMPHSWVCTLAMAASLALPIGLDKLGAVLNLTQQKDKKGKDLIRKMCKPRPPIQNIGAWIEWVEDDENLNQLYDYCAQDLRTEEEAYLYLKKYVPLDGKERDVWVLDQLINQKGFRVDLPLAKKAFKLVQEKEEILKAKLSQLTDFEVSSPKQVKALRDFLSARGLRLDNLQAKTIESTIKQIESGALEVHPEAYEVLKIRTILAKSSTSKLVQFIERCDPDDMRVRDNLQYHAASTGRWGGRGVQPQNFPRGSMRVDNESYTDLLELDLETLDMVYGDVISLISSSLRGMIVPSKGKKFLGGDFSAIEARVLLWCAGDEAGLKEYADGLDAYVSMAATIYNKPYADILAEYKAHDFSIERQLGKQVILACGYEMGVPKFIDTARLGGITLPESTLVQAHRAFRVKHPKVVKLWRLYEAAAIRAVKFDKRVSVGRCSFYVEGDFLFIELPNGRRLAYHKPFVRKVPTSWGEPKETLHFWALHSKTKKWGIETTYGGKLTENIVQAISRDLMAEAMLAAQKIVSLILTVHDELLAEADETFDLDVFKKVMERRPEWAKDLPLKVGAWSGYRYKK